MVTLNGGFNDESVCDGVFVSRRGDARAARYDKIRAGNIFCSGECATKRGFGTKCLRLLCNLAGFCGVHRNEPASGALKENAG